MLFGRLANFVNGELWGEDTSAHMHHSFADMIVYASRSPKARLTGLVVRSFVNLRRIDLGFVPSNVVTMSDGGCARASASWANRSARRPRTRSRS